MRAAVFEGPPGSWPQKPLIIKEVPKPTIKSGHVLIRVAACGLCHTDLLYLKSGLPPLKEPPLILGHEPSGIVDEVGDGVDGVKEGDRVVVSYLLPCRRCINCQEGRDNICLDAAIVGSSLDGAFAEYLLVPREVVFPIPHEIPLQEAAIITDAMASAYHAVVRRANVRPGQTVVVYGASGGLGLNAVQFSVLMGAKVIAVGRRWWKLELARRFGASEIISTLDDAKPYRTIERLTRGGADVAIDATGDPAIISMACRSVRRGGRVVVLGYAFDDFSCPSKRLLWYELDIIGSCNYKLSDLPTIIDLIKEGRVRVRELVSHKIPLSEINKGYEMLERGDLIRAVAIP